MATAMHWSRVVRSPVHCSELKIKPAAVRVVLNRQQKRAFRSPETGTVPAQELLTARWHLEPGSHGVSAVFYAAPSWPADSIADAAPALHVQ